MLLVFVVALVFIAGLYFGITIGKQAERKNQEKYRQEYYKYQEDKEDIG